MKISAPPGRFADRPELIPCSLKQGICRKKPAHQGILGDEFTPWTGEMDKVPCSFPVKQGN
jgi:hypothetical protein